MDNLPVPKMPDLKSVLQGADAGSPPDSRSAAPTWEQNTKGKVADWRKNAFAKGVGGEVKIPHPMRIVQGAAPSAEAAYRPVPQVTGNLQVDPEIVLPSPGMDVEIAYYYNSNATYNGAFGYGRTINVNLFLQINADESVTISRGNGSQATYISGDGGYISATPGNLNALTTDGSSWTETTPDGRSLVYGDAASDTLYLLSTVADAVGNTHTFYYDGETFLLVTIEDTLGREVEFTYSDGLLATIEDWYGRTTTFAYDTTSLPGQPLLTSVTAPSGAVTQYGYDGQARLTSILNPNDYETTYTYDSSYRVLSRTVVGSGTTTYSYGFDSDSGAYTTTVTYPSGGVVTYLWDSPDTGRVVEKTDAEGVSVAFARNENEQETAREYSNDLPWATAYNDNGTVQSVTDAIGRVTTITRDAYNNPTLIEHPDGTSEQPIWGYEGSDFDTTGEKRRLQAHIDALSNRTNYFYNSYGQVTQVENALGQYTTYAYGDNQLVSTITDPMGNVTTFEYDSYDNLSSMTDGSGRTWTYEHDLEDRLTKVSNSYGDATQYGYDGVGNLTAVIDALGDTTTAIYNAFDKPITITDPASNVTSFEYDAEGNLVMVRDPNANYTYRSYDFAGRLVTTTDALTNVWTNVYDGNGWLVGTIDPLTNRTSYGYSYGTAQRITTVEDPLTHTTQTVHDSMGRVVSIIDAMGNTTTLTNYANGWLHQHTDANTNVTTYEYDALGRLTTLTDALTNAWTTAYDLAGRVGSTTDPLGNVTSYTYDGAGRMLSVTDANMDTAYFAYDDAGRLITKTDPLTNTITYGYDACDRRTTVTDERGFTTTDAYNSRGLVVSTTDPLGYEETYGYDDSGNCTSHTDYNGDTALFIYDALNRLVETQYVSDPTVSQAFDAAGRVTSMTDGTGTTTYEYDAASRLTSVTYPGGLTLAYAYNAADRRTTLTDASDGETTYEYDPVGNMTSITNPFGETTTIAYDALNRESTKTLANGVVVTHTYDDGGRETELSYTLDGSPVADFVSTYDNVGNRLTEIELDGSVTTYVYDANNQLTSEIRTGPTPYTGSYAYDAAGNRTTVQMPKLASVTKPYNFSYAVDHANALSTITDTDTSTDYTYGYDNNGNLTAYDTPYNGTVGSVAHTWDEENRLTAVTAADGTVSTHYYAGDGMRRVRTATPPGGTASTTTFVWDHENAVQEFDSSGTTVYYTDYPGASGGLISHHETPSTGSPLSRFYIHDPSNHTRHLMDSSGNIVESYLLDAFGNVVSSAVIGSNVNASQVPAMDAAFGGLSLTPASSLHLYGKQHGYQSDLAAKDVRRLYVRARHFDTETAKWMSRDTRRSAGMPNAYNYCGNDGVNWVDSDGWKPKRPRPADEPHTSWAKKKYIYVNHSTRKRAIEAAKFQDRRRWRTEDHPHSYVAPDAPPHVHAVDAEGRHASNVHHGYKMRSSGLPGAKKLIDQGYEPAKSPVSYRKPRAWPVEVRGMGRIARGLGGAMEFFSLPQDWELASFSAFYLSNQTVNDYINLWKTVRITDPDEIDVMPSVSDYREKLREGGWDLYEKPGLWGIPAKMFFKRDIGAED